jgi:hypothetical protein
MSDANNFCGVLNFLVSRKKVCTVNEDRLYNLVNASYGRICYTASNKPMCRPIVVVLECGIGM